MNIGPFEITYLNKKIDTTNTYVALIGTIIADIVSKDEYINNGEYTSHYTLVREENHEYVDLLTSEKYNFRDENDDQTILKMSALKTTNNAIKLNEINRILEIQNEGLKNRRIKKDKVGRYIRTIK